MHGYEPGHGQACRRDRRSHRGRRRHGSRTSGFYLDLTDALEEDLRAAVDAAMSSLADARAVIEQARGVLMLAYTIPAERPTAHLD
ncbi:hypothetical protein NJ76_03810 [Rhodococcus sp. IITR03]|nr:hypothetical protein NJ76_03810 [Rhodococcus sp. IITR03]